MFLTRLALVFLPISPDQTTRRQGFLSLDEPEKDGQRQTAAVLRDGPGSGGVMQPVPDTAERFAWLELEAEFGREIGKR